MAFYHASQTRGLRVLLPSVSTHGKAYVYAIRNRLTALLFGAPKDDFDLLLDEQNGVPVAFEAYPGALQRVYSGKGCSLYEVSEDSFLPDQTGWEPEWVSTRAVPVLREERVEDLYGELLRAASQGDCLLRRYSEEEAYRAFLKEELSERVLQFGLTKERMDADPRFQRYLNRILTEETP